MHIRIMTKKDLPVVTTLYQDANQFAKKRDIFNWTKKGLNSNPKLDLICVKDKKIIGAISAVNGKNNSAIINDIVIAKKFRRHHIGRKLVKAIFEEFKKEKIKKVELWVHWKNASAIPFYYQFGFRMTKVEITKGIDGVPDGEDIIKMQKSFK